MAWVENHRGSFRVRYRLDDGTIFTEHGYATQDEADNRAADVESDQRRHRFVDPRLAETTIDEWICAWSDAHHVSGLTWAKYDSHIRTHILPRWSGTSLGDIARSVKGWVNKTLRANLGDKTVQDILILFSMILGEAVDEGLIGVNPCRKLRIAFKDSPERPHAAADEVDALAGRMPPDCGLMVITAAYTGMRWGELAGLQWIRVYSDDDNPRIEIDPDCGALHEANGTLVLGPPKTPASVRTVHLPRSWPSCCARTAGATRPRGSCSPGPTARCIAGRTSADGSGCPRWPGTSRRGGHRSTRRCTFMICVIPRKRG